VNAGGGGSLVGVASSIGSSGGSLALFSSSQAVVAGYRCVSNSVVSPLRRARSRFIDKGSSRAALREVTTARDRGGPQRRAGTAARHVAICQAMVGPSAGLDQHQDGHQSATPPLSVGATLGAVPSRAASRDATTEGDSGILQWEADLCAVSVACGATMVESDAGGEAQ